MEQVTFKFPSEVEFNRFSKSFSLTDCEINRKALTFKFKPTSYQMSVAIKYKAIIMDNNKYFG